MPMDEFNRGFLEYADRCSRAVLRTVLDAKKVVPFEQTQFMIEAQNFVNNLPLIVSLLNQQSYISNAKTNEVIPIDDVFFSISSIVSMGVFAQWSFCHSVCYALPISFSYCNSDLHPPKLVYHSIVNPYPINKVQYGYVKGTGEIKPLGKINPKLSSYEYRYVPNVLVNAVLAKDRKLTDEERQQPMFPTWKILANLVRTQSNQSRSQRMTKAWMCQALLYLVRKFGVHSPRTEPHWCPHCPDPFPILFSALWKQDPLPRFDDGGNDMRFEQYEDTTFAHTKLHYSSLNGLDQFGFGNITSGMLVNRMVIHDSWALESFDDTHLKEKGKMNSTRKLLHSHVSSYTSYKYSTLDCIGTQKVDVIPEIWMDGEKEQLIEDLQRTRPQFQEAFNYVSLRIKSAKPSDQRNALISSYVQLSIISNPSDYKFTAVPLEYDRSAKPVNNTPNSLTLTRESLFDFNITPEFFGIMKDMNALFNEYARHFKEEFQNTDFMMKFWDFLTNNSAGIPSDAKALGKEKLKKNVADNEIAKAFGKRYVTGLVEKPRMYDPLTRLVDQRRETLAGHRKQIDRRVRFISQVGNVYQAVSNVSNLQVKMLAKVCNTLVVGEQTGKITDLIISLYGSSDPSTVLMDNDIKGMDTATQEITSWWPLWTAFAMSDGTDQSLFGQIAATLPVTQFHVIGSTSTPTDAVVFKNFNGLQQVIAQIGSTTKSNRYVYVDGVCCEKFFISGTSFPTGAANTSANHNLTLGMASESIARKYQNDSNTCKPIIHMKVMGDDFEGVVKFTQGSQEAQDDAARFLMTKFIEHYAELGYIAEPEMSRYKGVFLQQTALMGAFLPLPARLSMQCAERGDSRDVDQISQLVELQDLIDELTGRSHYPQNEIPYLRIWWAVNRSVPLGNSFPEYQHFRDIHLASSTKKFFVSKKEGKIMYHFILPMMLVQFPENCGLTPYPIVTCENESVIPSYLTPRGTISYKVMYMGLDQGQTETMNVKKHWNDFKARVFEKRFPQYIHDDPTPVRERLNQDMARKLNLHVVRRIIKDNPFRKDPDMQRVTESVEKSTVLISANDTLDPKRADRSRFAGLRLSKRGIRFSDSVSYANSGRERLIQTLKAVDSERLQWDEINLRILSWVKKIVRKDHGMSFINDGRFYHEEDYLNDYHIYATQETPSENDYSFLSKSDFGPTCAKGSEMWKHVVNLRPPFGDASQWQTVESIKDVIPAGGNAETILREATNCYSVSQPSLVDYLYLIGVPDHRINDTKRRIIRYIRSRPPKYQSIAHTRKFFYCSTSPDSTERFLRTSGWNNSRSGRTLSQAIILDHMLMGRLDETTTYVVDFTRSGIAGLLNGGVRLG